MGQIRYIFLILILLIGGVVTSYAQISPPEPMAQEQARVGPPCDPGTDDDDGGSGVPPPVGLCLPIDDYVYLLMAVGVMYGCYKMREYEIS